MVPRHEIPGAEHLSLHAYKKVRFSSCPDTQALQEHSPVI